MMDGIQNSYSEDCECQLDLRPAKSWEMTATHINQRTAVGSSIDVAEMEAVDFFQELGSTVLLFLVYIQSPRHLSQQASLDRGKTVTLRQIGS